MKQSVTLQAQLGPSEESSHVMYLALLDVPVLPTGQILTQARGFNFNMDVSIQKMSKANEF